MKRRPALTGEETTGKRMSESWMLLAGRPFRPALRTLRELMAAPLRADRAGLRSVPGAPIAASAPPRPEAPPAAAQRPAWDMNVLLHQARSALLRRVPKGANVFLSAGCAGLWFFEWIERCYGSIPHHVGLEFYMPRPEGLAANVEWIANTCSDMSDVADGACDLVFSGQNLEHLWPHEVVGFLLEAARVLRVDGLLVMDSPNRAVTELLGSWSHPEHTVEMTTDEAIELVGLAGFEVTAVRGIWLGRDPATGAVLPFAPDDAAEFSVPERLMMALEDPANAFIWWLEARRGAREPVREALRDRVAAIFTAAWPERLTRMSSGVGKREAREGGDWEVCPPDVTGPLLFGPYAPLRAGRYRCAFHLHREPGAPPARVRLDVVTGAGALVERELDVAAGSSAVALDFALERLEFGVQTRCFSLAGGGFACRRIVDLEEIGDRP